MYFVWHASFSQLGAGSQVLQGCHQQSSVEAVPIPCKVTLLFSGLKVLCMACIPQFVGCWQQGPPRLPPAGLCVSSSHPLQGDIVVCRTNSTLYVQHRPVCWVLPGWPRLLLSCVCEDWRWAACGAERFCKASLWCSVRHKPGAATCNWASVLAIEKIFMAAAV